jgi:hypothetical protein
VDGSAADDGNTSEGVSPEEQQRLQEEAEKQRQKEEERTFPQTIGGRCEV